MAERPTVVLVHGAWHAPPSWWLLVPRLRERGLATVSVDLPSSGPRSHDLGDLHDDVDAIRTAIHRVEGPCVVVAHSYGGAPASEAISEEPSVRRLVSVAAFTVDVGQSVKAASGGGVPDWWEPTPDRLGIRATPLGAREHLYPDAEAHDAETAIAGMVLQRADAFGQELRAAGWHDVPSTYVLCERDSLVPPEVQERLAGAMGADVERLPTGHCPHVSRPDSLASILERACAA